MESRGLCLFVDHDHVPAKMAELIKVLVGLWIWVGPGNHVLDWGPDPPKGRGTFVGHMHCPLGACLC